VKNGRLMRSQLLFYNLRLLGSLQPKALFTDHDGETRASIPPQPIKRDEKYPSFVIVFQATYLTLHSAKLMMLKPFQTGIKVKTE
jgi:hypothetical protein